MTQITVTRDLPVTHEQLEAWMSGTLIQNAMPNLNSADREWIQTGLTKEDWKLLEQEQDAVS
jgi:hypothetical protein